MAIINITTFTTNNNSNNNNELCNCLSSKKIMLTKNDNTAQRNIRTFVNIIKF